jgi:hypothetical protein
MRLPPRGEESVHPNERERFAMHVKSSASPSPAIHAGAPAPAGAPKGAKSGPPDFSRMLNEAKAGAAAPMATPPAATAAAPATLSLDTASLAARA